MQYFPEFRTSQAGRAGTDAFDRDAGGFAAADAAHGDAAFQIVGLQAMTGAPE